MPKKDEGFPWTSLSLLTKAEKDETQLPMKWSAWPRTYRSTWAVSGCKLTTFTCTKCVNTIIFCFLNHIHTFVMLKCKTSPCPWRVSESLRRAIRSRWLCILTEHWCSSPRVSQHGGSRTGPVNTWTWSAAGQFDGRIPHTVETPWSEGQYHPTSKACRHFAVWNGKKNS